MRPILLISSLHSAVLFQLSSSMPLQDFFSSDSTPDMIEKSSLSSISTYVSDFLSTHKITIPQPDFEVFSRIIDYSSSTYEEALETFNSMLELIPYPFSPQELDTTLDPEEESLELENCHTDFENEPDLGEYSPERDYYSQPLEAIPEKKQEAHTIGNTILISELKGHGDMVVVGIVFLFLISCFTLEMAKKWSQHRNNLKNYRQNGIHLGKETMSDSINEEKNLSFTKALPI